ncbi:hypothetical protein [Haliscomenobacter hydrossis]|uniref:Uncharacterized protein n=1 Tax=Haliscomenobacter hydrossis (strain ATCC 27775 / DSM 1100 / LMG 10767 / O) TaxID=760192 RepID=F4KPW0_HALH1|nr:hypothetical protein [Haliscomenobacter hydrossis]AEE52210.1 hypothetical protein Halhy_4366 [Haliscomenobacter hydrossis DSM 1100]
MKIKVILVFVCCFLTCGWLFSQSIYIPPKFKGPIFFDLSGRPLISQEEARVYRIFRVAGNEGKQTKLSRIDVDEEGNITNFKNPEQGLYFYFEDHFISGEIKTQGHFWVTQEHQDKKVGLASWKVHLKGECRWYHINGQLSQHGVYDGAEWYGMQKEYDQAGKLIKSVPGKLLSQYDYSFEKNVLQRKTFSYGDDEQKSILPLPQTRPVATDELLDVKPIDIAAKMSSMPRFTIKNYRPYLGMYQGKTINSSLKKSANTTLEILEFIEKEGKIILELYAFGGFEAQAKFTGSVNDNVIFARGDWIIGGEKVGIITIATFLQKEEGQMEGFFSLRPFEGEGQIQSCSFILSRE